MIGLEKLSVPTDTHEDTKESWQLKQELEDKCKALVRRTNGTVPECIQGLDTNYEVKKIIIYTNDVDSPEFRDFARLNHFDTDTHFLVIKVSTTISDDLLSKHTIVATEEGASPLIEMSISQLIPGAPVVAIPKEYETNFKYDTMLKNNITVNPWSIGGAVIDTKTNQSYLITTYHTVKSGGEYIFYSQYIDKDIRCNKICESHIGTFGPWKQENDTTWKFVDCLLMPIDTYYLATNSDEMAFKNPESRTKGPISMTMFKGDLECLYGLTVYKYGMTSGLTSGRIVSKSCAIVVSGKVCTGLFEVQSNSEKSTTFATMGDSGSLVFGRNPTTRQFVAIGLVVKKSMDKSGSGILCSLLSVVRKYMHQEHGLEIEIAQPSPPETQLTDTTSEEFEQENKE